MRKIHIGTTWKYLASIVGNDEVIISDDGSKDGTVSLIESLHDDRIRILHYEQKVNYSKKKLSSYYYATSNFTMLC